MQRVTRSNAQVPREGYSKSVKDHTGDEVEKNVWFSGDSLAG